MFDYCAACQWQFDSGNGLVGKSYVGVRVCDETKPLQIKRLAVLGVWVKSGRFVCVGELAVTDITCDNMQQQNTQVYHELDHFSNQLLKKSSSDGLLPPYNPKGISAWNRLETIHESLNRFPSNIPKQTVTIQEMWWPV